MLNREMIKNIMLLSLFGLCVALTGLILVDVSTGNVISSSVVDGKLNAITDVESVFSPQSYLVSFGGGLHTGVFSEDIRDIVWDESKVNLKVYLQTGAYRKISSDEWSKAVNSRSFRLVFPFDYKVENIYQILGVPVKQSELSSIEVNTLIVPASESTQMFLGNERTGNFYVLDGPERSNEFRISGVINNIELSNITEYMRLEDIYSLRKFVTTEDGEIDPNFVENSILAPSTAIEERPIVKVIKEVETGESKSDSLDLRSYAVKAFGNDFDFVKKVRDIDDSIIYMYGYGEKALRLGSDGSIEYKAKLSGSSSKETDFLSDLSTAMESAKKYGEVVSNMYLSDYEKYESGKSIVRVFYFNYRIKELNVYTLGQQSGNAYKIEITDGKTTLISKNIRKYIGTEESRNTGDALRIEEVINQNADLVLNNYIRDNDLVLDSENRYFYIYKMLQDINELDLGYFVDPKTTSTELVPIWKIKISDTMYCFDLYNGTPLAVEKIGK